MPLITTYKLCLLSVAINVFKFAFFRAILRLWKNGIAVLIYRQNGPHRAE